jgi:hypothetical protein
MKARIKENIAVVMIMFVAVSGTVATGHLVGQNARDRVAQTVETAQLEATIKALQGEPLFELQLQPDGTTVWVRINKVKEK